MELVNLPYDIFPGKEIGKDEIIIHAYTARKGMQRGRSILHTNAISLVLQGQKTMHFVEQTLVVKEDSFHFLSAGNCIASMDLTEQEIFKSLLIFFPDKILADFYAKYEKLTNDYWSKHKVKPQAFVSLKKDSFIYTFIASLQETMPTLSPAMKQLKLEELLLYMLERYPAYLLSFQPSRASSRDLALRQVVETNIINNLGLEELAFLCNLSVSTFKRRFLKIYGCSPKKWFLQKKMELAANLLRNHGERPSDVFHKLGYETHSAFAQSFKQAFGKTPREYQEQI